MPGTAAPASVYIIDDHALLRAGFRSALRADGFDVVGDSGDARMAIDNVKALRPSVVLLDISMPGLSGLDAIARIKKVAPRTKVLMVSHHEGSRFVEEALRAGADGYLSKDSDPAEMKLAIAAVIRGESYLSPRVAGGVLSSMNRDESVVEEQPGGVIGVLTPREREVFQQIVIGRSNKEIARELGISLGTVKKHRENLQRKLDCHSAPELVLLAIREGLIEP